MLARRLDTTTNTLIKTMKEHDITPDFVAGKMQLFSKTTAEKVKTILNEK